MKYIFIAGLEHSGTTLIDHSLSYCPAVIGLGKVASFLSSQHMRHYMETWGEYPDARLCSCGKTWEDCAFWGDLMDLNGLNSKMSINMKYQHFIKRIQSKFTEQKAIVDSSKNLSVLKALVNHHEEIGLRKDDLLIIFAVKDVRSFTMSISKKNKNNSLLSYLRAFNYWLGANKAFLDFFHSQKIDFHLFL